MADQQVDYSEAFSTPPTVRNDSLGSNTGVKLNDSSELIYLRYPGMFSSTVDAFVTVYAISIFIANAIILAILIQMLMSLRLRKEADVVINMFFVCLNDTLSGLVLILFTSIKIDEVSSGYLCAYVVILCLSFLTMSQGNILCICFQRFMAARNLRKVKKENEMYRSICLLLINVFVAIISYVISILQAEIGSLRVGTRTICSFQVALGKTAKAVGFTFYYFQLVTTIVADILCIVTIVKLRQELNVVTTENNMSTGTETTVTQNSTNLRLSVRTRQQKAIITLLLLLMFFNVSLLPTLMAYTLSYFNISFNLMQPRFNFLFLYINSLVNPIIIMTRTQDIRLAVKMFFCNLKNKLTSCAILQKYF